MHHHFHLLTSKYLAIKESSSITLTIWGMKGLIQGNGQIKTLILATNADYALNQHLLTLIMLFNWWWAHCPYAKNSPLTFDETQPYYVKYTLKSNAHKASWKIFSNTNSIGSLILFVESPTCHCINTVIIANMTATSHKQPIWFREMKGTAGAVWLTWLVHRGSRAAVINLPNAATP